MPYAGKGNTCTRLYTGGGGELIFKVKCKVGCCY